MMIAKVIRSLALSAVLQVAAVGSVASPVTSEMAAEAVSRWLSSGSRFGGRGDLAVSDVRSLQTPRGVSFFVVELVGGGFVILSADTAIEPILAFSEKGDFVADERNPLWTLLNMDLTGRRTADAEAKWSRLLPAPATGRRLLAVAGTSAPDDVRVAPLLDSQWNQLTDSPYIGEGDPCYNFATPNNYHCGCVATAVGQIMRYHRYPTESVKPDTFDCSVDAVHVRLTMRGGVYDWANMPAVPANGTTPEQREAIGKLTADVGIACLTKYGANGSSAAPYMAALALTNRFLYADAMALYGERGLDWSLVRSAVVPNLDAKLPVLLGLLTNGSVGHAVVADGYGYSMSTFYLHFNLGWSGVGDAWYAPPDDLGDFKSVNVVVCNIRPDGVAGGVLCSGRVLADDGVTPRVGVAVRAVGVGGEQETVTDACGIFAFVLKAGMHEISSCGLSRIVRLQSNVGNRILANGRIVIEATQVANRSGCDLDPTAPEEKTDNPYIAADVVPGCETMGKVTGGNKNVANGKALTLSATANKGFVLAGWHEGTNLETWVSREAKLKVIAGARHAAYYARFVAVTSDWASVSCEAAAEYAPGEAINPIVVVADGGSLPMVKVTGLPSGLAFTAKDLDVKAKGSSPAAHYAANTIYGTPKKSGLYTGVVTVTTAGKAKATTNLAFVVRAAGERILKIGAEATAGELTGAGVYAPEKKVTLKAVANRGQVFAGWYHDENFTHPLEAAVDFRTASLAYVMPDADTTVHARFVPSADDDSVDLVCDEAYYADGPFDLPLEVDSASVPKLSLSGLPSGLVFDSKANRISGTATKPGTYVVKAKLTNVTVRRAVEKSFAIIVDNLTAANGLLVGNDASEMRLRNARDERYVISAGVIEHGLPSFRLVAGGTPKISGLPSGLKYKAATGVIEGVATKAGTNTVTVTAGNAVSTFTVVVRALPTWAVGTFCGVLDEVVVGNRNPAYATMTVAANGGVSFKATESDGGTLTLKQTGFNRVECDGEGNLIRLLLTGDAYFGNAFRSGSLVLERDETDGLGRFTMDLLTESKGGVQFHDVATLYQSAWLVKPTYFALPHLDTKSSVRIDLPLDDSLVVKLNARGVATVAYWKAGAAKAFTTGFGQLLPLSAVESGGWDAVLALFVKNAAFAEVCPVRVSADGRVMLKKTE